MTRATAWLYVSYMEQNVLAPTGLERENYATDCITYQSFPECDQLQVVFSEGLAPNWFSKTRITLACSPPP